MEKNPRYLKCPKCKSDNVRMAVTVFIDIDQKYLHRLTKKAFQTKEVKLMGASWDTMREYCSDCQHTIYDGLSKLLKHHKAN